MSPRHRKQKKCHLTIFLLKEGVDWRHAVVGKEKLDSHELAAMSGLTGHLYIKRMNPHPPWWLPFLQPAVTETIVAQNTGSMSAALFLEVDERAVVFTFGYGRSLVNPHSVEPNFGLRTALNAIDPDRLRSLDVRTYEDVALQTRRQVSRSSSTEAFFVDRLRDVLTQVVGAPRSDELGTRISGRDSLSFNITVEVTELVDVAKRLVDLFHADRYKEQFGWIDQVQSVKDPTVTAQLDAQLMAAVETDESTADVLYLAPPEILDWGDVEYFRFTSQGTKRDDREFDELELADYLSTFEGRRKPLSLDALKKDQAQVKRATRAEPESLTSVYRCLVFETTVNDQRYVLIGGDWWQIDRDFVTEVEGRLSTIPVVDLGLPSPLPGEREEDFVKRSAERLPGSVVLDQELIHYGGGRSKIEVCDLLDADGTFIHAKHRGRSSTLSHLWAQATVSGEAFVSEAAFRESARALLPQDKVDLVPAAEPERGAHGVTYLVIGADQREPWRSVPFFSKVALMQASRQLEILGMPLSLAGTPPAA